MTSSQRWLMAALGALVAALAGICSFLGVFARGDGAFAVVTSVRGITYEMATNGVYANNAKQVVAEGIGWDVFTLFLAVPVALVAMWFVGRGSFRAQLIGAGMLGYFFYQYLEYAMTWALGPLFPLYVAIFGLSLIGIVWFAAAVTRDGVAGRFAPDFPRTSYITITGAMCVLLALMWSGRILTALTGDLVGGGLHGETTLVVQALDLGLVIPLALLSAYLVYRRSDVGHAFAAAFVVLALAMSSAIVAMLVSAGVVNGDLISITPPGAIFGAFICGFAWIADRIYMGIGEPKGAADDAGSTIGQGGTRWAHGHSA